MIYWGGEWIGVRGLSTPWGWRALFDESGNALPALEAFAEARKPTSQPAKNRDVPR